jgi:uncharacterized membrane protein
MLIDRPARKAPLKSATVRMIAQGTLVALIVSVSVVVVSELLGHPAHPGVAAALAAVAASSHTARKKQA